MIQFLLDMVRSSGQLSVEIHSDIAYIERRTLHNR